MDRSSPPGPARGDFQKSDRTGFLLGMAALIAAMCVAGFAKTYFLPLWRGTFAGNWVFHVHGALLFGWVALFVVQIALVRRGQVAVHRKLGVLALVLVPAVVASTFAVSVATMRRDLAAGLGPVAMSSLLGVVTSMAWFAGLVALGLHWRRQPAVHKRLVFLATVAVMWPAAFRFRHYFPSVPHPEIYFGLVLPDALILVAMARDWFAARKIHPVYWIGGTTLIVEQSLEVLLFDSPAWRQIAAALAAPFL